MRGFPKYDEETPVPQASNHRHLPTITWRARFGVPKYGVSVFHRVRFGPYDKGKQRVVYLIVEHASESSNFYRIQEDLSG
jgi:hypothetical protein